MYGARLRFHSKKFSASLSTVEGLVLRQKMKLSAFLRVGGQETCFVVLLYDKGIMLYVDTHGLPKGLLY